MRVFVTGRSGFVGKHLQSLISPASTSAEWAALVAPIHRVDLFDRENLREAIRAARPDRVVHLAAQSFVPESFRDPKATLEVNFLGTLALLQALEASTFSGRMLYVGSGDEYGLVDEADLPVQELQPLRPRNPYAVSKVAAEALCYQWSQTARFEIIMVRPFNHIGPGQSPRFVVSDFARQLGRVRAGQQPPVLEVGDIDVTRDFTDVRDVVRAYLLLLESPGINGEAFNICSGVERSLRELIDRLTRLAGVQVDIRQDAARLRKSEQRRAYGSFDKLRRATGWAPQIDIDTSLRDILNYWTEKKADD
jgi:GDP-4-dehydro-6-deoxy-D-mannose reductase